MTRIEIDGVPPAPDALGETRDASVRVYVFEAPSEPATIVTVKGPAEMAAPQRLQSAHYQRAVWWVHHDLHPRPAR